MKHINKILTIALVALLGASVARASYSYEKSYMAAYKGRTDIPVPVSIVSPSVIGDYDTSRVDLKFIVDESGSPRDITVSSAIDMELALTLTSAIKSWKFTPALEHGKPVAKAVVLPVLLSE